MARTTVSDTPHSSVPDLDPDYLDLVRRFPLRRIADDAAAERAVAAIDGLLDLGDRITPGQRDYLDALGTLVAAYEDEHEPEMGATSDPSGILADLIEARGIKQAQVAVETGIPKQTISAILAGKRRPSRAVMTALGDYFGVHPGVFL